MKGFFMANDVLSQAVSTLSKVVPNNSAPLAPPKAKQKQCHNCCKVLIGPSYKKYCDAKCHDQYNNAKKAKKRAELKKVTGPMEQNDKFLERMYEKYPDRDWPMVHLQNPAFDGTALSSRVKDDRSEFEGRRFIRYSFHENPTNKTFKILSHG
jgi:hypothetical protein